MSTLFYVANYTQPHNNDEMFLWIISRITFRPKEVNVSTCRLPPVSNNPRLHDSTCISAKIGRIKKTLSLDVSDKPKQ